METSIVLLLLGIALVAIHSLLQTSKELSPRQRWLLSGTAVVLFSGSHCSSARDMETIQSKLEVAESDRAAQRTQIEDLESSLSAELKRNEDRDSAALQLNEIKSHKRDELNLWRSEVQNTMIPQVESAIKEIDSTVQRSLPCAEMNTSKENRLAMLSLLEGVPAGMRVQAQAIKLAVVKVGDTAPFESIGVLNQSADQFEEFIRSELSSIDGDPECKLDCAELDRIHVKLHEHLKAVNTEALRRLRAAVTREYNRFLLLQTENEYRTFVPGT